MVELAPRPPGTPRTLTLRIADLPWYDLPELRAATDAWWRGIAGHLVALGVRHVPDALHRDAAHDENWRDPRLLLSQACGYDVLYDARDVLRPVATPCYALAGCAGPRYSSVVVVRADTPFAAIADLRGHRCVVNEATSHSGTNALRPLVAPASRGGRFFASVHESGSHTDSLALVRTGAADVACVDVVVYELIRRVRPHDLAGLRVLARTRPALAPPYVTSARATAAELGALQEGLRRALRDPALAATRTALCIVGFEFLPAGAYAELGAFEAVALQHRYFELPAPQHSPLSADVAGRGAAPPPLRVVDDQDAADVSPRSCAEGTLDRASAARRQRG